MRWLFDMYMPFARRSQRELRSPMARLLVTLFCCLLIGYLVWLSVSTYLQSPTEELTALLYLGVPLLCAVYLMYVIYLVLFAGGRRVQRGLIATPYLKVLGYLLIPHGFWQLSHGRLDGAVSVVAGLACLGVARQRNQWFFKDEL